MTHRTIWLCLLMFAVCPNTMHAQVPGYQGKRTILRYDLGFFWDFFGKATDPVPVTFHKANLEYTLTETHVLGARYQFMRARVLAGDHFLDPIPDRELVGRLLSHEFGLYTRFYRYRKAGHIAPVGQYWLVGLNGSLYRYRGVTDVLNLSEVSGETGYGFDVSISMGTGKTFVIRERLVIDVGFEFHIPLSAWRHPPTGGDIDRSDAGVLHRQFKIFQVNLGIGALAF